MNFYDSKQFCRDNQNARLPKITSPGVQDFLHSFMFPENVAIWLGLTCSAMAGAENCWWSDQTHPNYTNYYPSYPQYGYPLAMTHTSGQWYSEYDFYPLSTVVVCQKPARPV